MRSLAQLFPVGVCGGRGGGAAVTNDWCINQILHAENSFEIYI